MKRISNFATVALWVGATGCSSRQPMSTAPVEADASAPAADFGVVSATLTLPDGESIDDVAYTLTDSSGATVQSGSVHVQNRQSISFQFGMVPAGSGYTLSLSASADGGTTCAGQVGPFDVPAHATATVAVAMACYTPESDAGNLAVTGNPFNCATWQSLATGAGGGEANLGDSITLLASATGPDTSRLRYSWSASSDIVGLNPDQAQGTADTVTLTCNAPGTTTIKLVVDDGPVPDGNACDPARSTLTTTVTCDASVPFTIAPGAALVSSARSAQVGDSVARFSFQADASRAHSLLTIGQAGGQSLLQVEQWVVSGGGIPLMTLQTPTATLQLTSADGQTFRGSLNGRPLKPFPISGTMAFLQANGLSYADGTPVTLPGPTAQLEQQINSAIQALQSAAPGAGDGAATSTGGTGASVGGGGGTGKPGDPPPYPAVPATFESTGDTSLCSNCTATALETLLACYGGALLAASGCSLAYGLCAAAGIGVCEAVGLTQLNACFNQGSPCCPTACGASGCCEAGHVCASGGSGTPALCCAGRLCGAGCCNTPADSCFESHDPSQPFQCCPAGQPLFMRPDGTQICCQVGDHLDSASNQCCSQADCSMCGHVALACCNPGRCSDPGSGCDSTNHCVTCPPPPPAPTVLAQHEMPGGSNCFNPVDYTDTFGPASCGGVGVQRVGIDAVSVRADPAALCTASWVNPGNPDDCRVTVAYHLPTDCNKHVDCNVEILVTGGALPSSVVRAELNREDGNTLNPTHVYTIGGRCDPGYHKPSTPPTPAVSGAGLGQSCTVTWESPNNPQDCTAVVTYNLGDLNKNITCDTQVIELLNNPPTLPAGCQ